MDQPRDVIDAILGTVADGFHWCCSAIRWMCHLFSDVIDAVLGTVADFFHWCCGAIEWMCHAFRDMIDAILGTVADFFHWCCGAINWMCHLVLHDLIALHEHVGSLGFLLLIGIFVLVLYWARSRQLLAGAAELFAKVCKYGPSAAFNDEGQRLNRSRPSRASPFADRV